MNFVVKTIDRMNRVRQKAERGLVRVLYRSAAAIRRDAAESIEQAEGASQPGEPIHTHRRAFARRALRFDVDREQLEAVIGPRASLVGDAFAAHEFGEEFRGIDYDERPTMKPALTRNLDRFADEFAGSIGD